MARSTSGNRRGNFVESNSLRAKIVAKSWKPENYVNFLCTRSVKNRSAEFGNSSSAIFCPEKVFTFLMSRVRWSWSCATQKFLTLVTFTCYFVFSMRFRLWSSSVIILTSLNSIGQSQKGCNDSPISKSASVKVKWIFNRRMSMSDSCCLIVMICYQWNQY